MWRWLASETNVQTKTLLATATCNEHPSHKVLSRYSQGSPVPCEASSDVASLDIHV
jgi:hypothetical protein